MEERSIQRINEETITILENKNEIPNLDEYNLTEGASSSEDAQDGDNINNHSKKKRKKYCDITNDRTNERKNEFENGGEELSRNDDSQMLSHSFKQTHKEHNVLSHPSYIHFSKHEALNLVGKLRQENKFNEAVSTLIAWLKHGECTKKNSSNFFSLIQSVNSHVKHLQEKKEHYIKNVNQLEYNLIQFKCNINEISGNVKDIFNLVRARKMWNLFTKAQRKKIGRLEKSFDEWQGKLAEDLPFCNSNMTEEAKIHISSNQDRKQLQEELEKLHAENNILSSQLEACKEEIKKLKDKKEQDFKSKEIELQAKIENQNFSKKYSDRCINCMQSHSAKDTKISSGSKVSSGTVNEKQARLIGIMSAYLNVHRCLGANVLTISSYLKDLGYFIDDEEVENILKSFPSVFKECVGKKWTFCAYSY